MPIDTRHPEYISNTVKWRRCRDAFEGSDAIKAGGVLYLPKLLKQKTAEYNAYKQRALFYSITSKTVSALVGMATLRPPIVKFPDEMNAYYNDDKGTQFMEYFSTALQEDLLMGRVGILADMPQNGGDPYLCIYNAESIINWSPMDDTLAMPKMVVLQEIYDSPGKDKYEFVKAVRYRELWMDENGVYNVQLFNANKDPLSAVIQPKIRGRTMDHIPFHIANPVGLGFEVSKSPMIDIVDINISHYQSSADLEHGRHFTALPTPYATGVAAGGELAIGSQTAWLLPDPQSKVGFLEFTGQGLQSLEKALQEKQSQLASLSARIMDNSKRGSEASDVVRLRYASETASLASVVRATEAILVSSYREIALMKELDPKQVGITLNKEFLDTRLKPAEVVDLVDSYLSGGITTETLVYNLRRGDITPVSADDEAEAKEIEKQLKDRQEAAKKAAAAKPKTTT